MNPLETLMRLWQGTLGPQAPQELNPYQAQDKELETLMLAANQPTALPIPPTGLVPPHHVQNLPGAPGVQQTLQAPFGTWSDSAMQDFINPLRQELLPNWRPPQGKPLTKEQFMELPSTAFQPVVNDNAGQRNVMTPQEQWVLDIMSRGQLPIYAPDAQPQPYLGKVLSPPVATEPANTKKLWER